MSTRLLADKLTPEEKKIRNEVVTSTLLFKSLPLSLGCMFLVKGLIVRGTMSSNLQFIKIFCAGMFGYSIGNASKVTTLEQRLRKECPNGFYAQFCREMSELSQDEQTRFFQKAVANKMFDLPSVVLAAYPPSDSQAPTQYPRTPSGSPPEMPVSGLSPAQPMPGMYKPSSAPKSNNNTISDVFHKYQPPAGPVGEESGSQPPPEAQTQDPWAVWNQQQQQATGPQTMSDSPASSYNPPLASGSTQPKYKKNKYGDEDME